MRRSLAFVMATLTLLTAAPALAGHGSSDKGDSPKHKVTQSPSWVSLEPMYATILDADRPAGLLLVEIGLDIPNEELREQAMHALPVLRDYYVRSLTSFTATAVRPWKQPDVGFIAERLQRVTDKALKKKGARVLLGQVAMRITR